MCVHVCPCVSQTYGRGWLANPGDALKSPRLGGEERPGPAGPGAPAFCFLLPVGRALALAALALLPATAYREHKHVPVRQGNSNCGKNGPRS